MREKNALFCTKYRIVYDTETEFKEDYYVESYCAFWPGNLGKDVKSTKQLQMLKTKQERVILQDQRDK